MILMLQPWNTTELWTGQLSADGKYLVEGSMKQVLSDPALLANYLYHRIFL